MSSVIVVTKDKKQVKKLPVTTNPFIIGRSPQCDLPLDEVLASRQHAEIILETGLYWIRDRASRNGTCLNGEKLNDKRELKDGDEISIGAMRLKFLWDNQANPDEDATRAASFLDMKEKSPGRKIIAKKADGLLEVKLRVADGPLAGGVFRNWESPITIGKKLENNVVLLDDAVSGRHAQIVQEDDDYYIQDLDSSNGTFLDGVKIQRMVLSNGQKIKVGTSTLVFEKIDVRKRRRNLKIALVSVIFIALLVLAAKKLQPPDLAGQHIEMANEAEGHGDFKRAAEEYEFALKIEPKHVSARQGLIDVQAQLEAMDLLVSADAAAKKGDFEKAKEIVYRVLRDFPKNTRALELESVIKIIENGRIAFRVHNWADAIRLLEKARETYSKNELIIDSLKQAQKESMAENALSSAKDALQHQQSAMAKSLLTSINSSSVYFTQAKEFLDKIEHDQKANEYLEKGRDFYRRGELKSGLEELEEGLRLTREDSSLLGLRDRFRKMEELTSQLASIENLTEKDGVDALLDAKKTCESVVVFEPDPLNSIRIRVSGKNMQIGQWLKNISQTRAVEAEGFIKSERLKEAMQLLIVANKADPKNYSISQRVDTVRKLIAEKCLPLYEEGRGYLGVGQPDLARERFKKIIEISFPGEDYYERAAKRLK